MLQEPVHFPHELSIPPSMRQQSGRQEKVTLDHFFQERQETNSEQSLHLLLQQKEEQCKEMQRKYIQIRQLKSRKPQGTNFMNGYIDDLLPIIKDKTDPSVVQELIDYINSMNEIHRIQQKHLYLCQQRLACCDQLVDNFRNQVDPQSLKRCIQQLQDALSASVTELDSNKLYRDLKKKSLQYAQLKSQFDILQKQNGYTEKNMESFKQYFQTINEDTLVYKKSLRKETSMNQLFQKRVLTLEQRLDVLSGTDYKKNKDTLRNIIDDMLKENESNKRRAFQKTQEADKLEQIVQDLKEKNLQLTRRVTLLEKQLKQLGYTAYDLNGNVNKPHIEDNEEINVLQQCKIPTNLNFKIDQSNKKNVFYELLNCGSKQSMDSLLTLDSKAQQDQIIAFMDIFVQYKSLAESTNSLLNLIIDLSHQDSIENLMNRLSVQMVYYEAESVNLWLIDQHTAMFFTYEKDKFIDAYIDTDEFANLVRNCQPIYKQQVFIYRNNETAKFVKDCFLVPLISEGRLIGIFTLMNLGMHKTDSKYLALITAVLIIPILEKLANIKVLNFQLKYKNILFDSLEEIAKQKTKYKFQSIAEQQAEILFGISNCQFYYIEQSQLMRFNADGSHNSVKQMGIVGYVAKQQTNILVGNIKHHAEYHQAIDIDSAFPVFTIYLQFGIIQIVLNQSAQTKSNGKLINNKFRQDDRYQAIFITQ